MGVNHGRISHFAGHCSGVDDVDRDVHPLTAYGEHLPQDAIEALKSTFRSRLGSDVQERIMDIKALLAALESAGLKLTTDNLAPLVGELVNLGVAAAQKGISDLSHKAGVADPTVGQ